LKQVLVIWTTCNGEITLALEKTKAVTKTVKTAKPAAKKHVRPIVKHAPLKFAEPQVGFSIETFEALLASRPFEPEWMRDRRRDAFHVLLDTPLPTRNDEAWRRTDFGALKLTEIETVMPKADGEAALKGAPRSIKEAIAGKGASGTVVSADGQIVAALLDNALKRKGVIFTDMETALKKHGDLLEPIFMTRVVRPNDGYFAALHGAFWQGGTFVYVPRGVEVPLPLRAATWLKQRHASFPHTLVVLEAGAHAVFIDEYESHTDERQAFNNGAVEIVVGDDAQLDYVNWQDFGRNVYNFTHERARVMRNSTLHWIVAGLGTRLTKSFMDANLAGQGAAALMSGAYFVNGQQHLDYDTEQNHLVPHTTSDLLYKGALKDEARSVWQGNIHVYPGAQRTDAYQASRNLSLSNSARADSIPGLEIEADDVRCTHGAAVSQVDREEIFYLMTRGIPEKIAEQLIVNGFFKPVLDRIPMANVRARLEASFAAKMGLVEE
jgi:Fe-S cluster assembly protein SufD